MNVDKIPIDSKPTPQPTASETALLQAALRQKHELHLLAAIESLLDLPTSPSSSPLPSTSYPTKNNDISLLQRHLTLFTPKDYDDLVEERNIASKCGFALCANTPPNAIGDNGRLGKKKMLRSGKLVELRSVGRYCGEGCARQALYLRVQLDTEPGWMRKGSGVEVKMLDEL